MRKETLFWGEGEKNTEANKNRPGGASRSCPRDFLGQCFGCQDPRTSQEVWGSPKRLGHMRDTYGITRLENV